MAVKPEPMPKVKSQSVNLPVDGTIVIPGIGTDDAPWVQRWDPTTWTWSTAPAGTAKVLTQEPLMLQREGQIDLFYLGTAGNLLHFWSNDDGATWSAPQDLGGIWKVIGGGNSLAQIIAEILNGLPSGQAGTVDLKPVLDAIKTLQDIVTKIELSLRGA